MTKNDIVNLLNNYCDQLIGEASSPKNEKKKLKIKNKSKKNLSKITEGKPKKLIKSKPKSDLSTNKNNLENLKENFKTEVNIEKPRKVETNDGFKIISEMPEDDSDISDAFESCNEDIDEEDFSDDVDEFDDFHSKSRNTNFEDEIKDQKEIKLISKEEEIKNKKLQTLKAPLLDIIKDFGMEDKISFENEKPCIGKILKTIKNDDDGIKIVDYSIKKKHMKKNDGKEIKKEAPTKQSVYDSRRLMKKMSAHEIAKMSIRGMKGEERVDAKRKLIVELGAKPLPKEPMNYREFQEQRKKQRVVDAEKEYERKEAGLWNPIKEQKEEKKRKAMSINHPGAGTFKNGVLKMSSFDYKSVFHPKILENKGRRNY